MMRRVATSIATAAALICLVAVAQRHAEAQAERDREGHGTERPLNADDAPGIPPDPTPSEQL